MTVTPANANGCVGATNRLDGPSDHGCGDHLDNGRGFTNAVQAAAGDGCDGYTTNNFVDINGPIPGSGDATNSPSRYYRIRLVP